MNCTRFGGTIRIVKDGNDGVFRNLRQFGMADDHACACDIASPLNEHATRWQRRGNLACVQREDIE